MATYNWCSDCGNRRVKRRGGVCVGCHQARNPTTDGSELRAKREHYNLPVQAVADALNMDARAYVDRVEFSDVPVERAVEIICIIEELAAHAQQEAEPVTEQRAAPAGALSIEAINERS